MRLGSVSGCEDLVPGGHVVRIQPALDLSPRAVPEDADDPGLHVDAVAASAHCAHRAHVAIACEDVVLDQPEPQSPYLVEPGEERLAPPDHARQPVRAGDMPDNLRRNEALQQRAVTGSKRIRRSLVGNGVGMLRHHAGTMRGSAAAGETLRLLEPGVDPRNHVLAGRDAVREDRAQQRITVDAPNSPVCGGRGCDARARRSGAGTPAAVGRAVGLGIGGATGYSVLQLAVCTKCGGTAERPSAFGAGERVLFGLGSFFGCCRSRRHWRSLFVAPTNADVTRATELARGTNDDGRSRELKP